MLSSALEAGRRGAAGLAAPPAVAAAFAVGVEPAGDAAAVEAQVAGEVLAGAAPLGQQDEREAVAPLAVLGRAEEFLQAVGLVRRPLEADQGGFLLGSDVHLLSILESNSRRGNVYQGVGRVVTARTPPGGVAALHHRLIAATSPGS